MGYLGRSPTPSPIDSSDIPANSIDASKIIDGAIAVADVADGAITEAKIADAAVVSLKSGRKNLIINGGFDVWQRATSTTSVATAAYYRTVDRFWTLAASGVGTHQRSTDVPAGEGFNYSMSFDATGSQFLGTSVELSATGKPGPFKANTDYTVSFWTKGTVGTLTIYYRNAIADGTDTTIVKGATSFSTSAGWVRQSTTFNTGSVVPHANNTHLGIDINNITNGGKITGVQLEEGSVATDFEHRSYGEELALCQRYYESGHIYRSGILSSGSAYIESTGYKVEKRTSPTLSTTTDALINATGVTSTADAGWFNHYPSAVTSAGIHTRYGLTWTADAEL